MAIIIEKEGKLKYHKVKCSSCGSILKYLDNDEHGYNSEGIYGLESIYYIVCPLCNDKIYTRVFSEADYIDFRIIDQ